MSRHIAMYIGSLNKGGAERVMCNLAEYFYQEDYKVTLVTTYLADDEYEAPDGKWSTVKGDAYSQEMDVLNPDEEPRKVYMKPEDAPGINRVFTALMPDEQGGRLSNFYNRVRKLRDTWKELKPDIILSFLGKNNCMAIFSARGLGIPVVVSVRSNPSREYAGRGLNTAMNFLFPRAAGVVVQTTGARDYFKDSIRKICKILPNSIHPDFMKRDITSYENRTKTIVSVGRLDDNKNQILLIRAFGSIMKDFPDYRLVIYGDGPSREKFEQQAKELQEKAFGDTDSQSGLDGSHIVFAGNVGGVADKIGDAEVFVLSSLQEGMPNALIEAMSLGLACISTDCPCGGPKDLIISGENGILIDMGSSASMEEDMSKALAMVMGDKTLSERLGRNALNVRKTYSPEIINRQWKEYFEDIISAV